MEVVELVYLLSSGANFVDVNVCCCQRESGVI